MSILLGNPLLFTGAGETGYLIERSLRFNSSDSAYLSRTPASAGNRKTWTWAGWVKRSGLGAQYDFASAGDSGDYVRIGGFDSSDRLGVRTDSAVVSLVTTQVFRDCSAWYHFVIAFDTTQATAANRVKLYVNGQQITVFTTATYPNQNTDWAVNNTGEHRIGAFRDKTDPTVYFPFAGYLADIHFIDGQALDPTSFGEFDDNGIWQPKAFSGGSFGTNGFHLDFADNSTAAALGTDVSGNGNTWTVNNFAIGGTASYARYLTQTSGDGTFSGPYAAFDGDTATACGVSGATGTGVITFTPGSAIPASSLRVYLYTGETGNGSPVSISVNGGSFTNCTTLGANNNSTEWVTATSLITGGQITSIAVQRVNMSGFGYNIYAIEVNGSQLLDASFAGNDSLVDVPVNGAQTDTGVGGEVRGNYATLNPLQNTGNTLSNGNLDASISSTYWTGSTINVTTGKWYVEFTVGATGTIQMFGLCSSAFYGTGTNAPWTTSGAGDVTYYVADGRVYVDAVNTGTTSAATAGDIISFSFDADARSVAIRKNNTLLTTKTITASTAGYNFYVSSGGGSCTATLNYGSRPFAYTAPSGFKALCTANLPAPVVTKPSTVMDVKLWTGNGSSQTITTDFSPDFVWIKRRDAGANYHILTDTVRGSNKQLFSNDTIAEESRTDRITAFNSDGFTLGSYVDVNNSTYTYAGWCWDAGSSTVTNIQGSITSSVRTNNYLSVVTYTGTGANATVGHGLGVAPGLIILKDRTSAYNWQVYHSIFAGTSNSIVLNSTAAVDSGSSGVWNSTAPTSTVFSIGTSVGVNTNGNSYVAYCFAPVAGYSSFGSYTGNGSADGPFVFCGFRPRFLLIKNTTLAASWYIFDASRDPYNLSTKILLANSSGAEYTDTDVQIDVLSNGFKLRSSGGQCNSNSSVMVFAAFAESPFQYARAR